MGEAPTKPIEKNAATKQMRVSFTIRASLIFGGGRSRVPNVHGCIKAAREMTPTELHHAMVTHTRSLSSEPLKIWGNDLCHKSFKLCCVFNNITGCEI